MTLAQAQVIRGETGFTSYDAAFRGVTSAILVHDWATWVAVPLVAGHIYLATLNTSTRHSLRGMTLGTVRREWARKHHPKWEAECE